MLGVDLVSVFFRSAFTHDTQAQPQASFWGGISYNSRSDLLSLHDKVISARYIAQIVNPVLLPLIRQEGDSLFQQDNARPHTAAATKHALRGAQKLPRPVTIPGLSLTEDLWYMMKKELTLSPEPM